MKFSTLKVSLISIFGLTALGAVALLIWALALNSEMEERLEKGWFLPPVELYASPFRLRPQQNLSRQDLLQHIHNLRLRKREADKPLRSGDYSEWPPQLCQGNLPEELPPLTSSCFVTKAEDTELQLLALSAADEVLKIYKGEPLKESELFELKPALFAQYYGSQPILRRVVELGSIPLYCSQSVVAIEDNRFLSHHGISVIGIFRAVIKNLLAGRYVQGGSTLTQQLVKNYFLTSERTLKRKITEQIMSIILELKVSKDEILQTYLNLIYLGANGPFQVRGFAAASEHYFQKPIEKLDLHECALLGAIIASPGRFDPFRYPDRAKERRNVVLDKMFELELIDEERKQRAQKASLPVKPQRQLREPAPYFVSAFFKKLEDIDVDTSGGLRIYTTLDLGAQDAAHKAIQEGMQGLDKVPRIKKLSANGHQLQTSLISIDLYKNEVIALMGGRDFKKSQYNRAMLAHRQVGSIMKPFVYLTALESLDENGNYYTPLTLIEDKKFTHKYEGQSWTPRNYDKKERGQIPLFFALKESLNIPTAKIGIQIGLNAIVDTVRRAGITSDLEALPALTLGAYELYPWEVAQGYSTIARFGRKSPIHFISRIDRLNGETLYQEEKEESTAFSKETTAVLIGMMKQTVQTGTGVSISTWRGFKAPAAGKTGTTSDTKDAWFAGFTPHLLTVVWVGFDDNRAHGLTGASGAIPIWTQYMKQMGRKYPETDFQWPEATSKYVLPAKELESMIDTELPDFKKKDTELIFRSANAPE
jgi:penicillin-binding protein 1B